MRGFALLTLTLISTIAIAGDCPNGDGLLKNNTPLDQRRPNGFGQFNPGSLQQAINNQPTNIEMIVAAAEQQGVPVDLALAVSYHESEGFNSCAGSDTGVKGPMQLTKNTGNGLGYNRDINEQNIMGGMKLLAPKSFLVIGSLKEFQTPHGINEAKFRSFELYRRNVHLPEVITFDELLHRARYIVEHS